MSFQAHRISAQDGLSLYVRDYGDRNAARLPILCLTGITRNSRDYHRFALRHCARHRIVVPEYRGRGDSARDPNWRNYNPSIYLSDIIQVLAALGLYRVLLVGTSLGGLLALALNAIKPTLLAGIVMNDIGPDLAPSGADKIMQRIGRDAPQPDWASAAKFLSREMPQLSIHDEQGWIDFAHQTYRLGSDGLLHYDWDTRLVLPIMRNTAPAPDLWALFRGVRHLPVMVARGGISDLLTAEGLARMVAVKPDLVAIEVPGVGHTPQLNEPEVEGHLDEFIDRF